MRNDVSRLRRLARAETALFTGAGAPAEAGPGCPARMGIPLSSMRPRAGGPDQPVSRSVRRWRERALMAAGRR